MTFLELKRLDRLNRANNEVAAQDIYDTDFILVLGRSLCDRDRTLHAIAISIYGYLYLSAFLRI
ncbi:MAG: hypothetical protein HC770_07285 [Pseudanabaena sp. CRU_2_10]|nr:hypothetical protein [Pseudanabaena sp. CRU_2_10]